MKIIDVLIIEDDDASAKLIKNQLESANYSVYHIRREKYLKTTKTVLSGIKFDVILLDFNNY